MTLFRHSLEMANVSCFFYNPVIVDPFDDSSAYKFGIYNGNIFSSLACIVDAFRAPAEVPQEVPAEVPAEVPQEVPREVP